jgi:outer membrane protein assembly factor BamB
MPLAWVAAAVLALAAPAWAVIPGLTGPIQALAQMLPQVLPFLAAGMAGVLSSRAWRDRLGRLVRWLSTPRGMACLCVGLGAILVAPFLFRGGNRSETAAAAPSPSSPDRGGEWTMFRANLSRTGAAPSTTGPSQGGVVWSFQDTGATVVDLSSSPAVVGGKVYFGSAEASVFDSSGMVYCVDAGTGNRVWRFQTEKQVFSSPAVVGNRVFVGEGLHVDKGCKLYCLDAATGKKLWAAPTASHTEASPAVVGGRVYTGAGDDGVYCLDAATGKPIWHFTGMHVDVSPAVANGRVYIGTGYGKLAAMALDAATGKPVWTTPCDLPVWGPPALDGKFVYYGIGNGDFVKSDPAPRGGIWRLDAATGKQAWRENLPDAVVTAVTVQGGRAFAGCRDEKVYSVDTATGKTVWSAPCGGPVVASPATDGTNLYVAGGKGQVHTFDLATGKPGWTLDLAPQTAADVKLFSSPALANGRLYLGTSKGKLFCVGQ